MYQQKQRDVCHFKDCGKASHGKSYCPKHMTLSLRRKLTTAQVSLIRSACCDAKCVSGEVHDNGEQYCTHCKEACCWKSV